MKNNITIVVVFIILAAGGIWYISKSAPASDPEQMLSETTPAPDTSSQPAIRDSNINDMTVEGSEFKFASDTLTVKKGEKVKLTFKNTGKLPHNWVVDELDIRTEVINNGTAEVIEFTPDKVGVFEYYCSVGKHRENGMVGKITVTE